METTAVPKIVEASWYLLPNDEWVELVETDEKPPYQEGYMSAKAGDEGEPCPYAEGTPEHTQWWEGFGDAYGPA